MMIVVKVLRQTSKNIIHLWMRCLERNLEMPRNSDILEHVSVHQIYNVVSDI